MDRTKTEKQTVQVVGLDCPDCAASLEKAVQGLKEVAWAQLRYAQAELDYRPANGGDPFPEIRRLAQAMGHDVRRLDEAPPVEVSGRLDWLRAPRNLATVLAALFLLAAVLSSVLGAALWLSTGLYVLSIVSGALLVARAGWAALRFGHKLDMNALMTIAAVGAIAVGEYAEGAVTMLLFSIGELLESYSADRARNAIRSLMRLAPDVAVLLSPEGVAREVPVAQVMVGEQVLVRPGARVPLDGRVVEGSSALDQSSVTGESTPVDKGPGDDLFAGTVNGAGALTLRVTRVSSDSTVARIARLIDEAQAEQAPVERFVDRFASIYTPVVVGLAALIAVVPPLLGLGAFGEWVYRALVLLVISCPCALVISTPVTLVSALARGARLGVLIKGGRYLEALSRVRAIALDKTGTLTEGKPRVVSSGCALGRQDGQCLVCDELIAKAAAVESRSEHALAEAVMGYAQERRVDLRYVRSESMQAVVGRGVQGTVNGQAVLVGKHTFVHGEQHNDDWGALCDDIAEWEATGHTVLVIHDEGSEETGYLVVSDGLRPQAKAAVAALRETIDQVVMLTGDNEAVAARMAQEVGIDAYQASLLPDDKVRAVAELKARYGTVAMLGDGINDAPALARADVGIAMGAAGSDVALETADVALMGDDLATLPALFALSRAAMGTIRANIIFALALKALFVGLAVLGYANLWMAVFADVGASLLVSLNGLRLLRWR